jgi:hypothetical protein
MPCDIHGHYYTDTHLYALTHIPNHTRNPIKLNIHCLQLFILCHSLAMTEIMPDKQEDRGRVGVGCGVWVWGVGVGDGAPAELLPRMPKPTARACRTARAFI